MKNSKALKILAPALALFAAAALAGCFNSSDNPFYWIVPIAESYEHSASEMTETQYASAASEMITINPTTKQLIISGLTAGKTIYMARTNPTNKKIAKNNSRLAIIASDTSASVSKSLAEGLASGFDLDFDFDGTNDPHKKIHDLFKKNLEEARSFSASKSLAPQAIQAAAKNYSVGDEETFWALDPKTLNRFYKRTFKLLVSEDNYNVWALVGDAYYKDDFEAKAQSLGTSFINGYNLVSHLYGEPAENLYNDDPEDSVYAPMATASRTGLKINIMLYNMLDQGKVYGFVYHGDVYHNISGSNEGRFVYIDSQTTLKTPLEANSTAQHEFSHTISKNQKKIVQKAGDWTYWYGELLAMICEDMMQSYLGIDDSDTGAGGGMGNTPKARLPQANALAWVNGISGEDSLAYASIFQFGAWLTRNFGGAKFIKELAQNAYVDMESVLNAVNAMGKGSYTQTTLLQKFAGDLLVSEEGKGFNKDADQYPTNPDYYCKYADGTRTYYYPLTAINLWDNFYGWCDTKNASFSEYSANRSIPFSQLPGANLYKKAKWESGAPEKAFLGPFVFKDGLYAANIGPYANMLHKLGEASGGSATINFTCKGSGFSDMITIYVK